MIKFFNQTDNRIDIEILDFLTTIKNSITPNEVELIIVDKYEIKRLNKEIK